MIISHAALRDTLHVSVKRQPSSWLLSQFELLLTVYVPEHRSDPLGFLTNGREVLCTRPLSKTGRTILGSSLGDS